jgi:hypothetical protein
MGEKTALAVIGILISIILLIAGTAVTVNYVQRRRGQQTMGQRIANSVRVKYLLHLTRLRKGYLIVPCQIMHKNNIFAATLYARASENCNYHHLKYLM